MYEIINPELNMVSCRLSDLQLEQVQEILSQWEQGEKIGSLTLFFNPKTDQIVLNADHPNYFYYREFAETYMSVDEKTRRSLKERVPKGFKEEERVLNDCIKLRETMLEVERAKHGSVKRKEREVLKVICEKCPDMPIMTSFLYGVMQGKRMERARRKNRS